MRSYGEGVAAAAAYGAPAPAPASFDGSMPERLSTRPRRSPRGADDSDGDSDDDGGYARAPASRAGGGSLSSKDKKDLRRERNREHARNSRERKRQRLELLSEENDELRSHCNTVREENLKLRALLGRIVGGEDPTVAQAASGAAAHDALASHYYQPMGQGAPAAAMPPARDDEYARQLSRTVSGSSFAEHSNP